MGRYILRRLIGLPPLLLGITLITFVIVHLTPGSPVDDFKLDPSIRPEDLKSIEQTLGLDRPLPVQYVSWLGQLAHGNLGVSLKNYRPVRQLILQRLPNTLMLTISALLLSLTVSVPLGIVSAVKRNSLFDQIATIGSTLGHSLPSVWIGLLFILFFSLQFKTWGLPWLPSGGTQTVPGGGDLGDRLAHMILPVLTLSLAQIATWTRFIRGQMLEVLGQDYVRTARAKGMREQIVIMRHAFRNASLPLITFVGLTIPALFSGAVIAESIFSWPGVGGLAIQAATSRDYTVVMGTVLFVSIITVLSNLLADIVHVVADPRIQVAGR